MLLFTAVVIVVVIVIVAIVIVAFVFVLVIVTVSQLLVKTIMSQVSGDCCTGVSKKSSFLFVTVNKSISISAISVPAKQPLSTTIIKMETNHYLLLVAAVIGHFFHFDFPVSPEPLQLLLAVGAFLQTSVLGIDDCWQNEHKYKKDTSSLQYALLVARHTEAWKKNKRRT